MVFTPITVKYILQRGVKLAQANQFVDEQILEGNILKIDKDLIHSVELYNVEILSCNSTSSGFIWVVRFKDEKENLKVIRIHNAPYITVQEGNNFTLLIRELNRNLNVKTQYEYMEQLRHK